MGCFMRAFALLLECVLRVAHGRCLARCVQLRRFVAAAAETERAALVALVAEVQRAQKALKERTTEALEQMLAQRATTNIRVTELRAPRIILPEDPEVRLESRPPRRGLGAALIST